MAGGSDTITANYSYGATTLAIAYSDSNATTNMPTFTYTLNNLAQVTQYTGPAGSSFSNGTITYAYDGAGQLTSVTGAETFTYSTDNNGNRTGGSTTITTGNEMANDAAGDTFTYDHNGNLATKVDTSGDTWTYTWDYRNRLTKVVESGNATLTENLTYDVFGNLIGVSVGGTQQRWTVFDGKNPYIDGDGSGTLSTRFLSNPNALDQFFGRVKTSDTVPVRWYLTDMSGSVREIMDGSGTLKDQLNYDPFGNVLYESNSGNADRFKFQGGEWDTNLGLYHFGDRWEDPVNGRWISQDPVGLGAGDPNLYRFTNNDPINLADPSGDTPSVFALLVANCLCGQTNPPPIYVIGNYDDTLVALGWPGHSGLALPRGQWSPAVNDAWVYSGIRQNAPFYIASPLSGRFNPDGSIRQFGIEYGQLQSGGYVAAPGDLMIRPSDFSQYNGLSGRGVQTGLGLQALRQSLGLICATYGAADVTLQGLQFFSDPDLSIARQTPLLLQTTQGRGGYPPLPSQRGLVSNGISQQQPSFIPPWYIGEGGGPGYMYAAPSGFR